MKQQNNIVHLHTTYPYAVLRTDRETGEESVYLMENFLEIAKKYWRIDDGFMEHFLEGHKVWTPYADYKILID